MRKRVVLQTINMSDMLLRLTTTAPPAGNIVINAAVCFLQLPTRAIHLLYQENGDGLILRNAATHTCMSVLASARVAVLEQNRVS